MQASCKHAAGQAEIEPLVWNHTSARKKCEIRFSKVHYVLFCLKQQLKQNLFLKAHWENFKIGCTKAEKIILM